MRKRVDRSEMSPMEETQKYYEARGKVHLLKTLIGYPRTSCLEEKDKQKPAFIGDSQLYHKTSLLKTRSKSNDILDKSTIGNYI